MNGLQVNKDFFSRGGVIGRWDFFVNNVLYSLGFMAVSMVGLFVAGKFLPQFLVMLTGFSFAVAYCYFAFINCYKRLRDIRGTAENQGAIQAGLTLAFFIPIVGMIAQFWLMFAPGMLTNAPENDEHPHSPEHFENAA